MKIKLTKAEKKAIEDLEKLAETWPKSLMLFSNSGSLYVLKVPRDQEVSMEFEVTYIPYIPNEGGDD
jgi:hypothetical protein